MEDFTVNIMCKVLHSVWTIVLQLEWTVSQSTLCGSHCKADGKLYCRLNVFCYCEHYVEVTAQQMGCVIW